MIDVLLAVEDPVVAIGLRTVLEDTEEVRAVGEAGTAQEIRDAVGRLKPRVVVMDVAFRRRDPDLIGDLMSESPDTRVMVRVDHPSEQCALRHLLSERGVAYLSVEALGRLDECCLTSLRHTASGCLPAEADREEIVRAVHTVADGDIAAGPWLAAATVGARTHSRAGGVGLSPITSRELEVISLVAKGLGNREVAERLSIREQTVKNHLGRIMTKLGLRSRLEVGLFAVRHHLIVREPGDG